MKKILVVSNSFGEDANRYVYGIARGQKPARDDVKIVTLYIGGCSLARHYRNMLSGEKCRQEGKEDMGCYRCRPSNDT